MVSPVNLRYRKYLLLPVGNVKYIYRCTITYNLAEEHVRSFTLEATLVYGHIPYRRYLQNQHTRSPFQLTFLLYLFA